ncbi:hypothetical protein RsS62_28170 [Rhizobium dioscoreae]|nr:hypothetical protein RsS62_28170 [Rhizobium dioscoreae]
MKSLKLRLQTNLSSKRLGSVRNTPSNEELERRAEAYRNRESFLSADLWSLAEGIEHEVGGRPMFVEDVPGKKAQLKY